MEIKTITNNEDLRLKNEPFALWGRMIPQYQAEQWSFTTEELAPDQVTYMTFPDEAYDYEAMKEDYYMIGAYIEGQCVGLAIYQKPFFSYLYLYDLKVSGAHRRMGLAERLIDAGKQIAQEHGYHGIYTQGQDNNLSACLFYINAGFRIGGLDTEVYKGTAQEGKADIIFYLDV